MKKNNNEEIYSIRFYIFSIILFPCLFFCLGYLTKSLYLEHLQKDDYQSKINGLWFKGLDNETSAITEAQKWDTGGDWVCINIRNKSYSSMVKTINHEVAHEVFARNCENNLTRCTDILK